MVELQFYDEDNHNFFNATARLATLLGDERHIVPNVLTFLTFVIFSCIIKHLNLLAKFTAVLLSLRYVTYCLYFCDWTLTASHSDTNRTSDYCVMCTKLSYVFQPFTLENSR